MDLRLSRLFRRRRAAKRRVSIYRRRYAKTSAAIAKRRKQIRSNGDGGAKAARFALGRVGRTEQDNRAPWLDRWARQYVGEWMLAQPWCGLLCLVAWKEGAGKDLPKDTVSTVAILNRARRGDRFSLVKPESARAGDLVLMRFGATGAPVHHVGLALGPMRGNAISTVEGNTSPSNSGSQSGGGGIYKRTRPRGVVVAVARPK